MSARVTFIGFGEAAMTFAGGMPAAAHAYDRKTDATATRPGKLDDYRRLGVQGSPTNEAAVADASLILSLVTADRALAAARETATGLAKGALYLDMNSVAPATKRAAAIAITAAGGRYVDAAILAPVHPAARGVPVLVAGDDAVAAADALAAIGFTRVRHVAGPVGGASAIKMIRSVMIKGMEALSAECVLAARAAGVLDEVIASLDASQRAQGWAERLDYDLDRMMVHGVRRAAEMAEVASALSELGVEPVMTRGTILRQSAIGELRLAPPSGLDAKADALVRGSASSRAAKAA